MKFGIHLPQAGPAATAPNILAGAMFLWTGHTTNGTFPTSSATATNPSGDYAPATIYEIPVVVHIIMNSAGTLGVISDKVSSAENAKPLASRMGTGTGLAPVNSIIER